MFNRETYFARSQLLKQKKSDGIFLFREMLIRQ